MQLFYYPQASRDVSNLSLEKEDTRHMTKVLRKKAGDQINITNGLGDLFNGKIDSITSNRTVIELTHIKHVSRPQPELHIAIAPTKMNDRMEWFIEKATEMGITTITPILCENSERRKINVERFDRIAISAMKQSLQFHKPVINKLTSIDEFLEIQKLGNRFIAHCEDQDKTFIDDALEVNKDACILIGPEGDFSTQEIKKAIESDFIPIALGNNRLRTETAGIYAVTAFNLINKHRS
ncbi:16S rRNA (uracil(1498)-N(3))-methyltransferase [Nonlabens ponticola]|uniref:Ribosomal RNA small subunit methyltransferase E n=1 Tax=Nonlabens ponticola TaxID=2496866 RepID=A0A3S9MY28_9FLAO|nr:16S rRNA (uracil(1498)-N(3))-methyltransferase [Nonlabens ponticola]AZQ44048.1 16S rRNA (uracil(1498)-N(3))-methyltransferase [Nonlabens ponticola]